MNKIISLIFIIIMLIGLGLAYTGLIPGLSKIIGADKPKDLGITYSNEMPKTLEAAYGPEITSLPDNGSTIGSIILSGSKPISYALTSEEITALMNFHHWKYYPLSNVQIRINSDGSVESSGTINVETALSSIEAYGFTTTDVRKAMSDYHIPVISMPFYAKFKGGIENNKITLSIDSFQAGKIPIPAPIIAANTNRVINALEALETKPTGFYIKKMSFVGGKVLFDGTVPEKEQAVGL
jgi:hypothetical protein